MTQALLLIDFQRDFGAPDGATGARGADLTAVPAAIGNAIILAAVARAAKVPVIFVRLLTQPGDEGGEGLCLDGTWGADFIGPQPLAGEMIISKTRFSAFARNSLADDLRRAGIDTLVLAGLTTECCVAATAWAAFEEGFTVRIAADACAAYEPALHDSSLRALALSGAELAQTSDIGTRWRNSI